MDARGTTDRGAKAANKGTKPPTSRLMARTRCLKAGLNHCDPYPWGAGLDSNPPTRTQNPRNRGTRHQCRQRTHEASRNSLHWSCRSVPWRRFTLPYPRIESMTQSGITAKGSESNPASSYPTNMHFGELMPWIFPFAKIQVVDQDTWDILDGRTAKPSNSAPKRIQMAWPGNVLRPNNKPTKSIHYGLKQIINHTDTTNQASSNIQRPNL